MGGKNESLWLFFRFYSSYTGHGIRNLNKHPFYGKVFWRKWLPSCTHCRNQSYYRITKYSYQIGQFKIDYGIFCLSCIDWSWWEFFEVHTSYVSSWSIFSLFEISSSTVIYLTWRGFVLKSLPIKKWHWS